MRRKRVVKKAEKIRRVSHSEPSKKSVRKEKPEEKAPILIKRNWPDPPMLEISKEIWEKPGVRVGGLNRVDWKAKGARAAIVLKEFEIFVRRGCHYNVLNGGMVDKKYVERRIQQETAKLTSAQKRLYKSQVINHILQEMASELHSIIPFIKKPHAEGKQNGVEFVRLYIMTSLILDGEYGEKIARILEKMRTDIRLYKQGGDHTFLKGIGVTKEKPLGEEVGWINPKRSKIPSQFASTTMDSDIQTEESAAESYPILWIYGGHGTSVSKPGKGEKKIPRISLPVSHIPMPRRPGEPSVVLNQIGVRILDVSPNGEQSYENWSLRDLVKKERTFVTSIKEGANEFHRKIVEALKGDASRKGYHIGELSDILEVPRETIEKEIIFLVEPKALKRTTWPGIYKDEESGRYNFHLDWFQERLRYPWPYDKDYTELKRLLSGCWHIGYNTTDYEFLCRKFPEIIRDHEIDVIELVGDITAGLKHHLIHKGQILSGINYTEQETFAGEIAATIIYKEFIRRFEKFLLPQSEKRPTQEQRENWIAQCLVLFLYIVGNHEEWQKETGHTPGDTFQKTSILTLHHYLEKFLTSHDLFTPRLEEIIRKKVIGLPEYHAIYEFPGEIPTELLHPGMSRTKTTSIRAEEMLEYSTCKLVDGANFHTTIGVDKWDPYLGQRIVTQVGAMTPMTYFEHGKLKRVDFGPTLNIIRSQKGRIFFTRNQYFHDMLLKEPRDKNTDINKLKEELGVLRCPV